MRDMAICPACGTRYPGREGEAGLEGYSHTEGWGTGCVVCGAPNLEWDDGTGLDRWGRTAPPLEWWPGAENVPLHNGWRMTAEHSQSHYGIPVLVGPDGLAYGTHDLVTLPMAAAMRGMKTRTLTKRAEAGKVTCIKRGSWRYLTAAQALAMPGPRGEIREK